MDSQNLNLLVTILLLLAVFVSWQYFFMPRRIATQPARPQAASERPVGVVGHPIPPSTEKEVRVPIETPTIDGSLLLRGSRFDDLRLKRYHETVDPKSPEIALLKRKATGMPYFAEMGWLAPTASKTPVPGDDTEWTLLSGSRLTPDSPVILDWDNGQGLVFQRRITIDRDYLFTIEDSVQNDSGQPATLYPYAYVAREQSGDDASSRFVHRGFVGVIDGHLKTPDYKAVRRGARTFEASDGWLGIRDHYWMAALIPARNEHFEAGYRSSKAGPEATMYQADYRLDGRVVAPGQSTHIAHRLFAGAKEYDVLKFYEAKQHVSRFILAIDWGWFRFLAKPLFLLLQWLDRLVGNLGVAILMLTVIMKTLFLPLVSIAFKSAAHKQRLQPQVKAIQEQYADDKARQLKEISDLHRRERVRPFAKGCLPLTLQIPVFFSLLAVLYGAIEMYHAPFFGWIHDLSAPDPTSVFNLFGLLPYHVSSSVPAFLSIGIWPILLGIAQWLQSVVTMTPVDPVQAKLQIAMPIGMTFLYAGLPAGLVIYYTWNSVLTIGQQLLLKRIHRVPRSANG